VAATPAVQTLRRRVEDGGVLSCPGVAASAQPFLAAALRGLFPGRPLLVVTPGLKAQERFHQDLQTWLEPAAESAQPAPGPLFYPAWEFLPHEGRLPHADVISERLGTLVALSQPATHPGHFPPLVVASVTALLQRTFPAAHLRARLRPLCRGGRVDPLEMIEWLEEQGYEPEAQVSQKGELALRGGILDVFPPTHPWPVRLEFVGNELESLREFDPQTQMSRGGLEQTVLAPAGELGLLHRMMRPGGPGAEAPDAEPGPVPALATLLDYLPNDTVTVLCEAEALKEQADAYARQVPAGDPFFVAWEDLQAALARRSMAVVEITETELVTPGPEAVSPGAGTPSQAVTLRFQGLDLFRPLGERAPEAHIAEAQRREFFAQLHRWLRTGCAVHVFCNNEGERQRFGEIWDEYGLGDALTPSLSQRTGEGEALTPALSHRMGEGEGRTRLQTHLGTLSGGFLFAEGACVVVTDAEVFGRYKLQRPRRMKSPHAIAARSALDINFAELEEGDYVVHVQHGIGRYVGLRPLPPTPGRRDEDPGAAAAPGQECLVIEFAPGVPRQPPPRLFVPLTEACLVSKYVGAGRARPPMNKLGSARWAKAKAAAVTAVRDLASELLGLQAARAAQPGFAFPSDPPWQREFEGAFIYEETPDQARAIQATKTDMETAKPMDRLICGDVGFGKTEVAIRAAFKAVLAGKQVAVLVPTTVLAQQHFNTFSERMADYPVRVELLSRFRTAKQQERVVAALAAGGVDIVIGTHRLVQADVQFKDLGLVVIDEEQRFGVVHKERLKQLRQLVDVLTLSATPIPRTLHLALTGARDMSTIETPPQDRLPVETIIARYDERLIRDAIQRELNRGGQVFYLHNRIFDIDAVADRLRALVPGARLEVGHGQMHSDDLERVMTRFVNGEVDVLLSTTIIESGIDIPNANTILIDRADRFGLSDLYQLRGRVGRYKHQAYAYLLLPRHAGLLADARKRITAIKQFSTPGSGFKIAMRDLEIRGAGNLLGAEQSGHITAVGFELYCHFLKQSIHALKGEPIQQRFEVLLRLDFLNADPPAPTPARDGPATAHSGVAAPAAPGGKAALPLAAIPPGYIRTPQHRIEVYRKLGQATDKSALAALHDELRDRFGPLPQPVELLLQVTDLKRIAVSRGVSIIETRGDKLMLTRDGDFVMAGGRFPRLTRKGPKGRLNEIRVLLLALEPARPGRGD